jgi:hypothetical protein
MNLAVRSIISLLAFVVSLFSFGASSDDQVRHQNSPLPETYLEFVVQDRLVGVEVWPSDQCKKTDLRTGISGALGCIGTTRVQITVFDPRSVLPREIAVDVSDMKPDFLELLDASAKDSIVFQMNIPPDLLIKRMDRKTRVFATSRKCPPHGFVVTSPSGRYKQVCEKSKETITVIAALPPKF